MKRLFNGAIAAAVLSMSVLSTPVLADNDDLQEMEAISKQFGFISLEEAKAKALAAKSGVVKDAELEKRKFGKGWKYEFEIVDSDGHEWEVDIDAKTGSVIGVERDWF
ncbi:MAG: PepSY domain-containing protein [Methylophilus sp.]|nr:PepSY domain-containing protein [Methylophilus sp.]